MVVSIYIYIYTRVAVTELSNRVMMNSNCNQVYPGTPSTPSLYKFNNFLGSPSLSHDNKITIAKSQHGLLPGPELKLSKKWNSSSDRFLAM